MKKYPELVYSIYDRFYYPLSNFLTLNKYKLNRTDDNIEPFFIIGSGRSGTTLLRRILIQSEGVHIPPETYVLSKVVRLFRQNTGMEWENLVNLILATIEYHPEFYTFDLANLNELSMKLKHVPPKNRSLALILDYFYKFHAQSVNKRCTRWGDKTPYNTLFLERIDELFPKAKYIFLKRNGYDVTNSYVKSNLYSNYFDAAKRWEISNKKALAFEKKNPEKVFSVKYEEFVSRPIKTGNEIFKFLGLDFKDHFTENNYSGKLGDVEKKKHHQNVLNKINTDSIGKGKEKIPQTDLISISKIIEPLHQKLGY
jgi:protein-tyrosine sulfotransferase